MILNPFQVEYAKATYHLARTAKWVQKKLINSVFTHWTSMRQLSIGGGAMMSPKSEVLSGPRGGPYGLPVTLHMETPCLR